ncbi:chalcone isomerase family protein [Aliiroseovarius sp. F20344]|uniref:chalcone isomerase family protein n=1 Tax=Aliiroseovarius sp. F20344 TaxID=2926414 RepID=UPI001FF17735|nr:chalcone isomerase family protein [Aliiroseovarius sp. F20344]MCK0141095.1 chalcone isomerase family protein [Aliiroseovarius sp. F20344]
MRSSLALLWLLLAPVAAQANTVESALPDAELRGAATFRFVGFPLYKARLFTQSGAPLDWNKDFGLELQYMRNLTEFDLVEGTMREFARLGSSVPVRGQLEICFDDVRKGDRYTAVSQGQNKIAFWLNGKRTCTLSHPQIKTHFMGIFLGDKTRSKSFTSKLKGE